MSDRIYHYVIVRDEHWAVRFDHQVGARKFVTLVDAVEGARILARERWEQQGLPSGVQIESPDGTLIADDRFGGDH